MIAAAGATEVIKAADSSAYMGMASMWPVAAAPGGDP
jgi:hypothetical protein